MCSNTESANEETLQSVTNVLGFFFTATVIFHLHTVQKMLVWREGSKKKKKRCGERKQRPHEEGNGGKGSKYGKRRGTKGWELETRVKQRSGDEQHIHTVHFAVRHSAHSAHSSVGAGAAAGSGPAVLCGQNSTGVASFLWENGEV